MEGPVISASSTAQRCPRRCISEAIRLVTSLLASEMQRRGHRCAILDADITGPSIPKSFGITEKATGTDEYLIPVTTYSGMQIMSINLILEDDTAPVVWRGPVIAGAVTQFWTDVL